jgi:hypothetical protein
MRRDIALLCSGAIGGLAMLPGWEGSQGAVLERRVALAIGLDVRTVTEWPLEWCSHD